MSTSIFLDNQQDKYEKCESCHEGEGAFYIKDFIRNAPRKIFIKYIHDDIIPPGSSFGNHEHKSDTPFEEWYLCLAGEGIMQLDGKEYPMKPGDISACFNNGEHGIKNTGKDDMRILVIAASPAE